MSLLVLACAGLAAWLWIEPTDPVRCRLAAQPRAWSAASRRRGRRVVLAAASATVVVGLGLAGGPRAASVGLAAVIVVGTVARLVRQSRLTRAEHRIRVEVASACSVIANQVRVGRIPAEAIVVAAEDAPVLAVAARVMRNGGDVVTTLLTQARDPGCRGLQDLARAWQVGTRTGAPMADLLDQVAQALRADQAVERTVAAELAGPRATGQVMAVLPLCGIGLGYLLGGDPVRFLLAGPLGWACLVLGVGFAAVGALWIDWLARQVGRT